MSLGVRVSKFLIFLFLGVAWTMTYGLLDSALMAATIWREHWAVRISRILIC